jgi:hypothetical protein
MLRRKCRCRRSRRLLRETLERHTLLSSPDRFEPSPTLANAADVGVVPGVHLNQLLSERWANDKLLTTDNQ